MAQKISILQQLCNVLAILLQYCWNILYCMGLYKTKNNANRDNEFYDKFQSYKIEI